MTTTLQVKGMTCGHCKAAVTKALEELQGVQKVAVNLQQGTVDVDFDAAAVSLAALKEAIEDQGYDVQ
ncbi:copper chaperone CopZ [Ectobacillus ponti]|uniref:Copper chaperone CopZ n=1 Tax=Ectobacillus ponti TaxID=2961894 RepID=A0AA41X5E7_9BACI|nr:copper chaperone CopZ [Ectobacillus ponti]MCP8969246.1 copper chaperone CopZ [Ectobacillus ponti]